MLSFAFLSSPNSAMMQRNVKCYKVHEPRTRSLGASRKNVGKRLTPPKPFTREFTRILRSLRPGSAFLFPHISLLRAQTELFINQPCDLSLALHDKTQVAETFERSSSSEMKGDQTSSTRKSRTMASNLRVARHN
jgi:hypothetical protein